MRRKYDAIVVGGGPAGAATATYLARAGREVLLLDRARFPRDKPCGEFLSPPVWDHLRSLGAERAVEQAGVRPVPAARVIAADGRSFQGAFAPAAERVGATKAHGFSIERIVLDHILLRNAANAGVDVREGVPVRSLLYDGHGVSGVRSDAGDWTAALVIGADGSRSRVARELGLTRPLRHLQKLALVSHYSGVPLERDHPVEMHVAGGRFVCGFGPGPNGTADVTIVVPESESRAIASAGTERYADGALQRFPEVSARLRTAQQTRLATCGTFGHTTRRPIADGAMLVGDAAAFIDPFTGEGVYFALRGAQMAAETALAALRSGDLSMRGLAPYAAARRRELSPKYLVCDMVQQVVARERALSWFAGRFVRRPALVDSLLGVTGDMESPYRLLSPGVLLALMRP